MTIEIKKLQKRILLDHEKLTVYQVAIEFIIFSNAVIENLPRGKAYLSDQLQRAALSISLNMLKELENMQLTKRLDFIVLPNDQPQNVPEFWKHASACNL